MTWQLLTQRQYVAWRFTRRAAVDTVESLASTLVDAEVDLNPHQIEAALFACRNPLSRGVILADEAGLVISQRWAERRRRILIVIPVNLHKQWHQALQDKFGLQGRILEARSDNALCKQTQQNPFLMDSWPIICSYQFAKAQLLREVKQRNLGDFEQEEQKLDAWADDLKLRLEQEIKEIDCEIKEVDTAARKKGFKEYAPGFIHIDIKYPPRMFDEASRRYLLAAIDRARRPSFPAYPR
jgi:hypothetical protein